MPAPNHKNSRRARVTATVRPSASASPPPVPETLSVERPSQPPLITQEELQALIAVNLLRDRLFLNLRNKADAGAKVEHGPISMSSYRDSKPDEDEELACVEAFGVRVTPPSPVGLGSPTNLLVLGDRVLSMGASDAKYLETAYQIIQAHRGVTTPFEDFFVSLLHHHDNGGVTPDEIEHILDTFREEFKDAMEVAEQLAHRYPEAVAGGRRYRLRVTSEAVEEGSNG